MRELAKAIEEGRLKPIYIPGQAKPSGPHVHRADIDAGNCALAKAVLDEEAAKAEHLWRK
jgi:hypothetical protein